MTKHSAGILLYRLSAEQGVEVLLVHPGGPYWRKKDAGAWQLPKGVVNAGESALAAACRETEEELGISLLGVPTALATVRQAGDKIVEAFALEQDLDPVTIASNMFELEWPPRSGRVAAFPEIDEARWFGLEAAASMMLASQLPLLDALRNHVLNTDKRGLHV